MSLLDESLALIDGMITHSDWPAAEVELELFAEEFVEALIERRDDDIRHAADRLETLYSRTLVGTRNAPEPKAMQTVGQLRGYAALLLAATRHRAPPSPETVLSDETSRLLLDALQGGRASNRDLARRINRREETVARTLPKLRAAGLVASVKAGRAMHNELTEAGRQALATWSRRSYAVEPAVQRTADWAIFGSGQHGSFRFQTVNPETAFLVAAASDREVTLWSTVAPMSGLEGVVYEAVDPSTTIQADPDAVQIVVGSAPSKPVEG